jgi:hypothetical protein
VYQWWLLPALPVLAHAVARTRGSFSLLLFALCLFSSPDTLGCTPSAAGFLAAVPAGVVVGGAVAQAFRLPMTVAGAGGAGAAVAVAAAAAAGYHGNGHIAAAAEALVAALASSS